MQPWCLRKLYLATRSEIERNVRLPAEQAMSRFWIRSSWLPDGRRMRAIPSKRMFAIDIFSPRGVRRRRDEETDLISFDGAVPAADTAAGFDTGGERRGLASRILRSIRMDRTCGKTPQRKAGNRRPWKVGPPMNRMAPVRQMSRGLQGIQRKMSRQRFREIPLRVRIPRPPRSLRESWIP